MHIKTLNENETLQANAFEPKYFAIKSISKWNIAVFRTLCVQQQIIKGLDEFQDWSVNWNSIKA